MVLPHHMYNPIQLSFARRVGILPACVHEEWSKEEGEEGEEWEEEEEERKQGKEKGEEGEG